MCKKLLPLYLAIRLENNNFEIARWSRVSSGPSSYDMVAAEAKHEVNYSTEVYRGHDATRRALFL